MILHIERKLDKKRVGEMIEAQAVYFRFETGYKVLYYLTEVTSNAIKVHPRGGFKYTHKEILNNSSSISDSDPVEVVSVWHPERREVLWRDTSEDEEIRPLKEDMEYAVDVVKKKSSEFLNSARDRYKDFMDAK